MMIDEDNEGLKLGAVIVGLILLLSWGTLTALKHLLKSTPPAPRISSEDQIKEQQRRMDEIRYQQKLLMENQQQRIRDLQRK